MVISNMSVFLQHSIYYRMASESSSVAMVGATPYKLFFKVHIIENSGGVGSSADGLTKNKFCTDMLGLLSPKTTLNLC